MAEIQNRLPENVPGSYYVSDDCIDCDLCRENAPAIFRRSDAIGFSTVFHQPTTPEEIADNKRARSAKLRWARRAGL